MATSEQFSMSDDGLLVRAPGKINLSLLVKGKRPDGYHDIESIMAKIDWFDEILIEHGNKSLSPSESQMLRCAQHDKNSQCQMLPHSTRPDESGLAQGQHNNSEPVIELICKGPYRVPEGEENLVYKAAKLILETARQEKLVCTRLDEASSRVGTAHPTNGMAEDPASPKGYPASLRNYAEVNTEASGGPDFAQRATPGKQKTEGIKLTLTKNMPAGSGLGSGSSDAAATLMGINKFLKLGLGKRELTGLAAKIGSDVAFFLDGPLGMCTGKGEKVKKLPACEFRVFLIIPDVSLSTKRVYENYRQDEAKYRRLSEEINIYIEKKRVDLVCRLCANMLAESCFELHPELGILKKRIESLGIRPVGLSGSGSSMFSIIERNNEEAVKAHQDKLARDYSCRVIIVNNNGW